MLSTTYVVHDNVLCRVSRIIIGSPLTCSGWPVFVVAAAVVVVVVVVVVAAAVVITVMVARARGGLRGGSDRTWCCVTWT